MFLWLASLTVICAVLAVWNELSGFSSAESVRTVWETAILFFVSCSGVGLLQCIMSFASVYAIPFLRYERRKRASPVRVGAWMHTREYREYNEGKPIAAFPSRVPDTVPVMHLLRLWAAVGVFLCASFVLPNVAKQELEQRMSGRAGSHAERGSANRMQLEPPMMIGRVNQPASIIGWTFAPFGTIGTGLLGFPCTAPPNCRGNIAWLGLGYDGGVYEVPWTPILCRLTNDWRRDLGSAGGLPMCLIPGAK